jgi:GT2 family glycosyltransferase
MGDIKKGDLVRYMKCSIIIPYAFSTERALRLFHSLENQDFSKSDYELIFVNYGKQDSLCDLITKNTSKLNVKYVALYGERIGKARNLGIRKASGELVIFINGDEIADRNFVSGHYDTYKKLGRPVIQFGLTKQVFEDNEKGFPENNELFRSGIRYWLTEPEKYGLEKGKSYYYIKDIRLKMLEPYCYDFDKVHYKMIFTKTSNLSVPMECIKRYGALDEDFRGQEIEDWEFGYRMMKNGVEIVYNPQVSVLHLYEKEQYDSKRYCEWKNNLDTMLNKYNDRFLDELTQFRSFFDPVRRERLNKAEPSRNIWLEVYKHLERTAGKKTLANVN